MERSQNSAMVKNSRDWEPRGQREMLGETFHLRASPEVWRMRRWSARGAEQEVVARWVRDRIKGWDSSLPGSCAPVTWCPFFFSGPTFI